MSNEYKAKIGKLVDNISESYRKECYIAPHDFRILPNRTVIIDTTKALQRLVSQLFPEKPIFVEKFRIIILASCWYTFHSHLNSYTNKTSVIRHLVTQCNSGFKITFDLTG